MDATQIKRFVDRGTMFYDTLNFTGRDRRPAVGGYQGEAPQGRPEITRASPLTPLRPPPDYPSWRRP